MNKKNKKNKRKNSEIQAIIFPKRRYSQMDALRWLLIHNYKPIKPVDIAKNFYRYRINPPRRGAEFRMIKFGDGIQAIVQF